MPPTFKEMTEYFRQVGAAEVGHTQKTYLAHVIGVYRDLQRWGCDEELCRAAMFHSIYGTELFQRFALSVEKRDEVRQLIGERAERLAYWNCCMDRATFDHAVMHPEEPPRFRDRITGEEITPSEEDFTELCRIHLCDWLEQVERSSMKDYRRDAYQAMAERLGGIAQEEYQRVFGEARFAG